MRQGNLPNHQFLRQAAQEGHVFGGEGCLRPLGGKAGLSIECCQVNFAQRRRVVVAQQTN